MDAAFRELSFAKRYDERPFIAIWETTQACDLVCKHCRACARPARDAEELTSAQARKLLEAFAEAQVPLVVLTGGDPAKRPDLVELVAYGRRLGLHIGLTPSATPLVTPRLVHSLADAGLARLAISIDGPDASTHEAFRGVPGTFEHSLRILREAAASGISTQVNTTMHEHSIDELVAMARLVRSLQAVLWSVFYIVPTGRANARMLPSAERVERSLEQLAEIAEREPFTIKTTAAPHYRRIVLQRSRLMGKPQLSREAFRVTDGRGLLFVSHRGEIYPSGFLPIACGNVKHSNPLHVYRDHPVFRTLRDAGSLTGKCAACEYRNVCRGSRARAFAMTGDMMGSDPLCAYVPPGYTSPELDNEALPEASAWTPRNLRVVQG